MQMPLPGVHAPPSTACQHKHRCSCGWSSAQAWGLEQHMEAHACGPTVPPAGASGESKTEPAPSAVTAFDGKGDEESEAQEP